MSERTKIVVEQYPVRNLPEELRQGLDRDAIARVTIEAAEPARRPKRSLTSFVGSAKGVYASPEEAVDFIRKLRDEWE